MKSSRFPRTPRVTSRARVRGLSLIELMVALAISAILTLGLVQIFSAQRATFNANQGLARVQENSRFAMDFLRHDMRMGSHMGCLGDLGYQNQFFNHLAAGRPNSAPYAYRFDLPVQVYDAASTSPGDTFTLEEEREVGAAGDWSPALPVELGITGTALEGSDVLVVRFLSADYTWLFGDAINASTNTLTVHPLGGGLLANGGIYALTNCSQLSLFQVTGHSASGTITAATGGGDNQHQWGKTALNARGQPSSATTGAEDYGRSMLFRYQLAAYYVAEGADGRPALFRRELDPAAPNRIGAAQEVVPGVESLQIVLGVNNTVPRLDDQPAVYMTANAVQTGAWRPDPNDPTGATMAGPDAHWRDVVSLRVGLLMASTDPASGDPAVVPTFRVADALLTPPADQRLRQVYETHINVRNRSRG